MTDALAIYGQFDGIQKAAMALYKSGYFKDSTSEAQAIVKVMAGAELGLPPFASMSGIHIIQGKPALGLNVIATLVKNDHRYDYRVKQCDNNTCTLAWFENGKPVGESSFTMKEAQDAGLTSKDNWRKFPSDMLFARAISRGARRFAPGIFGGSPVYTPEELGADTDPEGYVETTVTEVAAPRPAEVIVAELGYSQVEQEIITDVVTKNGDGVQYPPELMVVTASDGKHYVDMDTAELSYHMNGILKGLKKAGITEDEKAQYNMKYDVIRQILALRK